MLIAGETVVQVFRDDCFAVAASREMTQVGTVRRGK